MVDSARNILLKAIQFRDSQTMSRYGSVIRSAWPTSTRTT